MGWKVESMEDQKKKFILLWETNQFTTTELCRQFGISRPTGYHIIKRYLEEGWDALEENSRKHFSHPFETDKEVQEAIIRERNKHPRWGARKIRELLFRDPTIPYDGIPSETTVNVIMKKNGLVIPRKRAHRHIENRYPVFDPKTPNEVWSTDFKGKFRLGNREYCNPLTIADSCSRYIFAIEALERADTESCEPIYEKVFREYGLPLYMHADNGAPFGNSVSLRRMTRLAVWFMEIGITPVYSDPGHPEQNGRHERMHRDLKAEATRPAAKTMRGQQIKFKKFCEEYNKVRPHEALDMMTPHERHVRSSREYPRIVRDWDYEKKLRIKMVTVNGAIRWKNDFVMISSALSGKYIGLDEIETGIWMLYYRQGQLGVFSERAMQVYEVEDFKL